MTSPTPNAARYHEAVFKEFSWAVQGGIFNCRGIAGSGSWSQHAWANADDVMVGPWGTASGSNRARGDALVNWLLSSVTTTGGPMLRYQAYGIRTILWWGRSRLTGSWIAGHTDHVHVDFWPKGNYTPPCAGGSRRVSYPNGTSGTSFRLYPAISIIPEEELRVATYRTVTNVPSDKYGKALGWAKEVVDWGIKTGLIQVKDKHPDDWNEAITSGRLWTFMMRQHG